MDGRLDPITWRFVIITTETMQVRMKNKNVDVRQVEQAYSLSSGESWSISIEEQV